MVKIKCSWCGMESNYEASFKTRDGEIKRNVLVCKFCFRPIPSSIKVLTGNVVGASHFHKEYR